MTELETMLPDSIGEEKGVGVALVAPVWLREALLILLQSMRGVRLVASCPTVNELLAQTIPSVPDLVLIDAKRELEAACEQVSLLKTHWPDVHCIVLADHIRQQDALKSAGADRVLIKGAPPQQICAAIQQVRN
jgi:DNA-binding NarL/FixJ family response regulator